MRLFPGPKSRIKQEPSVCTNIFVLFTSKTFSLPESILDITGKIMLVVVPGDFFHVLNQVNGMLVIGLKSHGKVRATQWFVHLRASQRDFCLS